MLRVKDVPLKLWISWLSDPAVLRRGLADVRKKGGNWLEALAIPHQIKRAYGLVPTSVPEASQATLVLGPPQPVQLPPSIKQRYRQNPIRTCQGPPLVIKKTEHPLWQKKGWTLVRETNGCGGSEYRGHFKVYEQAWPGRILTPYAGRYIGYIQHPPSTNIQKNTHHWACFTYQTAGAYSGYHKVHYRQNPKNLSHAITTVEDLLTQALE